MYGQSRAGVRLAAEPVELTKNWMNLVDLPTKPPSYGDQETPPSLLHIP